MKTNLILALAFSLSSLIIFAQNYPLKENGDKTYHSKALNRTNILSNDFNRLNTAETNTGNYSTNISSYNTNGLNSRAVTNRFTDRGLTNGTGDSHIYTNDDNGIYSNPPDYSSSHSYKNPYPVDPKVIGGTGTITNK